jgi:hypothetical protein
LALLPCSELSGASVRNEGSGNSTLALYLPNMEWSSWFITLSFIAPNLAGEDPEFNVPVWG